MTVGTQSVRPRGSVRVFAQYESEFRERAEVVVVGSGPGGAVVAAELARRGKDVLLVEEGPPFTPADFELDTATSMARTMREAGLRATRGYIMPTMQAIALGGGSLVNSAICVRPPEFVLDDWCERFGLTATSRADLDPHFDAIERELGIEPTPDAVQGRRNLLFREGCEALGLSHEPIARNVRGCRGSGECFTGCRSRAKQSMDVSYVPEAIAHGARVLTSAQVQRVLTSGRRVTGVSGQVVRPFTGETSHAFTLEADVVVLAAGVMATPVLLQKSGDLANRSGQVGHNLQFHPGAAAMGLFPDRVDPVFGATQGYQSLEFIRDGFKMETLWAPPAVLAVRMPGFGFDLKRRLAQLPYAAVWDAIVSTRHSFGTVRARRGTLDPDLRWSFDPRDVQVLARAAWVLTRLFFAAGAHTVMPGLYGVAEEMHSVEEAESIARREFAPSDIVSAGNHVFSTTRMHGDGAQGVVDELGRCHDVDNLYVADSSVFPRSTAVNPMLTVMALARRTAGEIGDRL